MHDPQGNEAAKLDKLASAWRSLPPERRVYHSTRTTYHMHRRPIGLIIALAVILLGAGAFLAGLEPGLVIGLVLFGVIIGVLLAWSLNSK